MRIEDAIKNGKLDVESPPVHLWENIRNEWKDEREPDNSQSNAWKWKAAAVVFILSSVGLLMHNVSLQNKVAQLSSLGDISSEYKAIQTSYETKIQALESSIAIDKIDEFDDLAWMRDELNTLNEVNKMYRSDIGEGVDEQQLVKALIDYYEKKIKLLKRIELEINRTIKQKKDEKGTNSISI